MTSYTSSVVTTMSSINIGALGAQRMHKRPKTFGVVQDGCNQLATCVQEFICCSWNTGNQTWTHKKCTCNYDFVFSEVRARSEVL
jgi:hypothetical protein